MSEALFPLLPDAPKTRRVDPTRVVNSDGTVTIGDNTYVPATVGTGLQGYDPGEKGKFSTSKIKTKRQGDGDDGFNFMAGWLGTGGRQEELLQEGSIRKAANERNFIDKYILKITPESLQNARLAATRDELGEKFNGRLKAAGAAPVGWGEGKEEVEARLEENKTRKGRKLNVKQRNNAQENNFTKAVIRQNENAGATDLSNTFAIKQANLTRDIQKQAVIDSELRRADAMDAKSMEYRLLQDKMDREDYRYAEDNKRFEKNKREELIRAATLGLLALNSGFKLV